MAVPITVDARDRLEALGDSYRSVGAIGGAALLLAMLMLIALPGVKGVPGPPAIWGVVMVVFFGLWGIAVGIAGRWICRNPTPERLRRLNLVAALAAVHLPFGTWAAVRTLWVRWRIAVAAQARSGE